MAIMAILMLRFWRGFQAPSARFPRITTAVRAYQSLEHWRKWRWISYPSTEFPSAGIAPVALRVAGEAQNTPNVLLRFGVRGNAGVTVDSSFARVVGRLNQPPIAGKALAQPLEIGQRAAGCYVRDRKVW
jgi:hypothetical protein